MHHSTSVNNAQNARFFISMASSFTSSKERSPSSCDNFNDMIFAVNFHRFAYFARFRLNAVSRKKDQHIVCVNRSQLKNSEYCSPISTKSAPLLKVIHNGHLPRLPTVFALHKHGPAFLKMGILFHENCGILLSHICTYIFK